MTEAVQTGRSSVPPARRVLRALTSDQLALIPVLIIVFIIGALVHPAFLTPNNLINVLRQSSELAIVVIAQALILIAGKFDLSLESIVGLAPMLAAWLVSAVAIGGSGLGVPPLLALLVLFGVGLVVGVVNGGMVVKLGLNPFIATLAMLILLRGITVGLSGGKTLYDLPPELAGHGLVDFVFWLIGGANAYFALPPIFHQPLEWLLFGPYPAATWLGYVLLGLWAQRSGLLTPRRNTPRVACALVVALSAGAATSFTVLAPWMQTTLVDMAAGAAAISVVWTSVYVFEYVSRHVPTLVIRASVCLGVVPLSTYVLHVMLLACVAAVDGVASTRSIETYVLISVACVSFALIVAASRVRGPIEAGVAWLASSAAREVT